MAALTTRTFCALCAVIVCWIPALRAKLVDEPDSNCDVWIEPPEGVDGAVRIGLGKKALCGSLPQSTCQMKETCLNSSCSEINLTTQHCWCDEGCDVYGDCCTDSPRHACYRSSYPFPPGSVIGGDVSKARRATEQCVRTWIFSLTESGVIPTPPDYRGHWLVADCPANYNNHEIRSRCESEQDSLIGNSSRAGLNDTSGFIHTIPVTSMFNGQWMHYKNMYCAFCRGVTLQDMVAWSLTKFDCRKHRFVVGVGPVEYPCPTFAYRFNPPGHSGVANYQPRPCKPGLVTDCPFDEDSNITDGQSWAAALCSSYEALINCGELWYKNPHCCVCHGLISGKYCFKPNTITGSANPPISIPFDFLPLADDAIGSVALDLGCPQGFNYSFNAQKCVLSGVVTGLLCDKPVPVITTRVSVSVDETAVYNKTWKQFFVSMFVDSLSLIDVSIRHLNDEDQLNQRQVKPFGHSKNRKVSLDFSFDVVNMSTAWEQFSNLSAEMAVLQKRIATRPSMVELNSIEMTESCIGVASFDACAVLRFEAGDVEFYVHDGVTYMYQNGAPVVYQAENLILQVSYILQSLSSTYTLHRKIISCNATKDLLCHRITLSDTSEYRIQDGVMTFKINGKLYESTEYLILPDGRAQVCHDDFQDLWFAYSSCQYLLNVLGTSLSSLALVLTFVTYCTLSSLRTVPGKAIMHFVVALFAGELLLLIGASIPADSDGLCTFTAALSHYVWLACFLWMTSLGFDVSRTFSMRTGPRQVGKAGCALQWMCLFSWGSPAVILTVCLALHFACSAPSIPGEVTFSYGYGGVCWIRPETANLLAFGLPVMASLLVNGTLFVKTVLGLRASKKITSFVEKDKSLMQRASDELVIYLKVSILMGLTWIWFFVAAFTGETVIYYIAIALNAFHGCYVFAAFVCNRRVWNMWRRKLRGKPDAGTSSISGATSAKALAISTSITVTKSPSVMTMDSPAPEEVILSGTRL